MDIARLLGRQGTLMAGHLEGVLSKYFTFKDYYAILELKINQENKINSTYK